MCGERLLIIDKSSSFISVEVIKKCILNLKYIFILPDGSIRIMQSLDISINKKI